MQVTNNQLSSYNYNTNSSSTNQTNSNPFNSYLNETKEISANAKLVKSNILSFIEKNNGFSSLSNENEELFKKILADDIISTQEVKNLTWVQAKAFNEFQQKSFNLNSSEAIPIFKYEDDSASNTLLATSITYDEDFNKAFFETLKNMNTKENNDFYNEVSDSLGYNNRYCLVPEPKEEYFAQLTAMEKEKYKDYENPEKYIIDYTKWEIKDYSSFIQDILKEYTKQSQNSLYALEQSLRYKSVSKNLSILEKNYNEIKNISMYK